jgi:hypothetical protein
VGAIANAPVAVAKSQPILVRPAELSVSRSAALGYFHKAKRLQFANCRSNCVSVHTIFDELLVRNGKVAVIVSAIGGIIQLQSVKARGALKRSAPCRRVIQAFQSGGLQIGRSIGFD